MQLQDERLAGEHHQIVMKVAVIYNTYIAYAYTYVALFFVIFALGRSLRLQIGLHVVVLSVSSAIVHKCSIARSSYGSTAFLIKFSKN